MHPQSRTKAPPLGHAIGFDANLSYNPVYDDGAIDTLAVCHKLAVATTMKPEEQQALAVDNNSLRMGEATRTLTGDHESRVSDTGTSIVQPAVCKTLSAEGYDGMPDPVKQNGMPIVSILTGHSQANGSNVSECGAAYTVASDGQAAAMCVDAYNQSATIESCMTLRSAMTGTDGNDADPKVVQSAGFMIGPSAKTGSIGAQVEESPTLDTNGAKGVAIGFNSPQPHSTTRGFGEDVQPTFGAAAGASGNNKPMVAIGFKAGQSANGGLGDEVENAPTLSHNPSALEPTVAIKTEDADAIAFIPYGSRLGADLNGIAKTITAIDAKFPQCVGIDQQGGKSSAATADDISPTMLSDSHGTPNAVAFAQNTRDETRLIGGDGQNAGALAAEPGMKQQTYVALNHIVRRLTPGECETLQGFPRDWTKIPYRNKPADQCPDSPRYKALGNSMATNCVEWVLRRIVAADRLGLIPYGEEK